MKLKKSLLVVFYVVSFFGIIIQSIPSIEEMLGEAKFEVQKLKSKEVGFHTPHSLNTDDLVMVDYNGESYHGIFIEKFSITNRTGKDIRTSHFESDIEITVKNDAEILSIESINANGEKNKIDLEEYTKGDPLSVFPPHLINDREKLSLTIVSSEEPAKINFDARIEGVKGFAFVSSTDIRSYIKVFELSLSLLIMTIFSLLMALSTTKIVKKLSLRFSAFLNACGMIGSLGGVAMYGNSFFYFFDPDKFYYFLGSSLCFIPFAAMKMYIAAKGEDAVFGFATKDKEAAKK